MISRRETLKGGLPLILMAGLAPRFGVAADALRREDSSARILMPHIRRAVDALDRDRLVKLAMDLCNVPSPLGYEDRAARFLRDRMKEEGLVTRLQPFAPDRSNAVGIFEGTGRGRRLMLVGHLETGGYRATESVPAAEIIDGKFISAVGIWNMKGALAAYVAAVAAIRKAGIAMSGDVVIAGVAGTADETLVETRLEGEAHQGYSIGTKHLLAQGGHADFGLVGEPTSFKLVPQHFGMAAVRIDVDRRWIGKDSIIVEDLVGPVSSPLELPPADAVSKAAEIVQALRAWIPDYQRRHVVAGRVPRVTIPAIEGGSPGLRFPARKSSIFVFVPIPPGAPPGSVLDEIRSVLTQVRGTDANIEAHAELYSVDPGPFVPDDSTIVSALRDAHVDVFGKVPEVSVVDWHSDASPLAMYGIPAVNYGPPGKLEFSADGPQGEIVRIDDLLECTRVYIDLIVRVCSGPKF